MTGADVSSVTSTFPDPDLQLIKDFNMNLKPGADPDVFLRVHMDVPLRLTPDKVTQLEAALLARDGAKVLELLGTDITSRQGSGTATLKAALGM